MTARHVASSIYQGSLIGTPETEANPHIRLYSKYNDDIGSGAWSKRVSTSTMLNKLVPE